MTIVSYAIVFVCSATIGYLVRATTHPKGPEMPKRDANGRFLKNTKR